MIRFHDGRRGPNKRENVVLSNLTANIVELPKFTVIARTSGFNQYSCCNIISNIDLDDGTNLKSTTLKESCSVDTTKNNSLDTDLHNKITNDNANLDKTQLEIVKKLLLKYSPLFETNSNWGTASNIYHDIDRYWSS